MCRWLWCCACHRRKIRLCCRLDIINDHKGIRLDVLHDRCKLDDFDQRMLVVLNNKRSKLDVLGETGPQCCIGLLRSKK